MKIMTTHNNDWAVIHDNTIELYSDFRLVENNSILNLANKKKMYLFHCTDDANFVKIVEGKQLLSSGGCLVASIYCTPAIEISEDKYRLHNLGGYYYFKELPFANKVRNINTPIRGLLIELIHEKPYEIAGINYLHMNSIKKSMFLTHKHLLSDYLYEKIIQIIINNLNAMSDFLLYAKSLYQKEITYRDALDFIDQLNEMVKYLPILGHFIFEAVSKYIMLYQDDPVSNYYKNLNEIYNWNYKNMFFYIYPELYIKFDLGKIKLQKEDYIAYIRNHSFISNFSDEQFIEVITIDIINMIYECLISNICRDDFYSLDESLINKPSFSSICGSLLHEKLKQKEYETLLNYIEYDEAADIWNYWKQNNISVLYNNILAKGELGLNPYGRDNYQYKIYDCDVFMDIESPGFFINKGKKLDIEIASDITPFYKSKNRG